MEQTIGIIAAVVAAICGVIQMFGNGCSLYRVKTIKTPKKVSGSVTECARVKLVYKLRYASETEYFTHLKVLPKNHYVTSKIEHDVKTLNNIQEDASGSFSLSPKEVVTVSITFVEPFPKFAIIIFCNSKIWKTKASIFWFN